MESRETQGRSVLLEPILNRITNVILKLHSKMNPHCSQSRFLLSMFAAVSLSSLITIRCYIHSRDDTTNILISHLQEPPPPNLELLQMDILCPVYQRDDRIETFARNLGIAVRDYNYNNNNNNSTITSIPGRIRISKFRLFLTRYSEEERRTAEKLQQQISLWTSLPTNNIVMVMGLSNQPFERSSAVNLLQEAACHQSHCLVARIDVDMKVKDGFFDNAVQYVYDQQKAYFPIVWSEYYPLSARLVEAELAKNDITKQVGALTQQQQQQQQEKVPLDASLYKLNEPYRYRYLDEHSEHRGYWRIWGTGMYCLLGPHAQQFRLNESFKGWGGEDGNFYNYVSSTLTKYRVVRENEPGLIHLWHPKTCRMGVDVMDDTQWKDCQGAKLNQMGSEWGMKLLNEHIIMNMPDEYQHLSILF